MLKAKDTGAGGDSQPWNLDNIPTGHFLRCILGLTKETGSLVYLSLAEPFQHRPWATFSVLGGCPVLYGTAPSRNVVHPPALSADSWPWTRLHAAGKIASRL